MQVPADHHIFPSTAAPTSVEDVPVPEAEHLTGAVPLLQGRRELRGRDVQVNGHQGDADKTDMDPPLSHLERSDGGGLVIPASAGHTACTWDGDTTTGEHINTTVGHAPLTGGGSVAKPLYKLKPRAERCDVTIQRDTVNDTCA